MHAEGTNRVLMTIGFSLFWDSNEDCFNINRIKRYYAQTNGQASCHARPTDRARYLLHVMDSPDEA